MQFKQVNLGEVKQYRRRLMHRGDEDDLGYPGDEDARAVHLALFVGLTPVGCASFLPSDLPNRPGGYRLRGVVIEPTIQRRELVEDFIRSGMKAIARAEGSYLWCNARVTAVDFYHGLGFKPISDLFDVRGIGLHRRLVRVLEQEDGQVSENSGEAVSPDDPSQAGGSDPSLASAPVGEGAEPADANESDI